jgi:alcohol dehydrogenase
VGICGTDISGYLGKFPFYSYPRIPGHELGVEVLAVGSDVDHVAVGDRCCVEPYINDPESFASRRGHSNCCNRLQVLGVHTDGGMRERFVVPARKLHPSNRLTWEQLALVETLAIGCHAVDRAAPSGDDQLLLVGAGPIGLSVLEFARLTPAQVTVMDMNQDRLDFCQRQLGVASCIRYQSDGEHMEGIKKRTDGNFFTIVIDATGSAQSMSSALEYVAHTGRLVFVGITTEEIRFRHPLMHAREMSLLASRNALPGDFQYIIRLIEAGTIDTRPWITHTTTLDRLAEDFPSYTQPQTGVIKAMVEMP